MIDFVALVHGLDESRTVELFALKEKGCMERVVRAAHNPDERVAFVSTEIVDLYYSGNVLAYVDAKIQGDQSLTVRDVIETLNDKKKI